MVAFGKIIRQKRLEMNLRMDDVAQRANITRSTLWSIEKGVGNCSVQSFFKVLDVLGLSLSLEAQNAQYAGRCRATRINSAMDKKKNRFIIMCIEQYALYAKEDSSVVYQKMADQGIIAELENDYEDLHGMSTVYLNDYISSQLFGGAA